MYTELTPSFIWFDVGCPEKKPVELKSVQRRLDVGYYAPSNMSHNSEMRGSVSLNLICSPNLTTSPRHFHLYNGTSRAAPSEVQAKESFSAKVEKKWFRITCTLFYKVHSLALGISLYFWGHHVSRMDWKKPKSRSNLEEILEIPQDFRRCVSNKTKRLEASKAKYREGLRNSGCLGSGRRVIQSAKYDPGNKNGHSALSLLYPKESLSLFWWLSSISGTWRKILSHQFFHRTQMTMALTRRKCWFLLLYFMLKIRSHIQYIS